MKRYKTIEISRKAKRENNVLLLNPCSGDSIEMDDKSADIFDYIQNNYPEKTEIVEHGKQIDVIPAETLAFIKCLEEMGFIYETD